MTDAHRIYWIVHLSQGHPNEQMSGKNKELQMKYNRVLTRNKDVDNEKLLACWKLHENKVFRMCSQTLNLYFLT